MKISQNSRISVVLRILENTAIRRIVEKLDTLGIFMDSWELWNYKK